MLHFANYIAPLKIHIAESVLIERLRNSDRSALEYLYDNYSAALYGVILRVVKQDTIAEEVLQDVFFKIWNRFSSYDESKGKLFTWMVKVARNQAIDKTRSREITKDHKTAGIDNFVNRIDGKDFTQQAIDSIGIQELLKTLPQEQQFVVEHLYLKGYSQSELAEESGIPLGTIKTRTRLAMQQLRLMLGVK